MSRENISEYKMMAHVDRIVGEHKPVTADVFITNYCNNDCPYCTYHRWEMEPGARYMKYEDFKVYGTRLIMLGVRGIILTGGGEPMINPDFNKIADWMTHRGIRWGINTNFNVFHECRPSYIKVSLDGWDEESYKKARGVTHYSIVRENIIRYAEWKKENSHHTSLGIQMVADDEESVNKFYEGNRDLPVDYIVFRPVESTGGAHYREKQGCSEKIISAVKELADSDDRVTLNFKWNLLNEKEESCVAQWAQIAVNEQGQVMYCCHKPYEIVGDVMDSDILEKKERYATDMSMCDIPCRMTAPNKCVSQIEKIRVNGCFI